MAISSSSWEFYYGGVHSCSKGEKVDHAVLLVGYDENGWILKNQWGDFWGEAGYIRIGYGDDRDCSLGVEVITLAQFKPQPWCVLTFLILLGFWF